MKCKAETQKKTPCTRNANEGSDFCTQHSKSSSPKTKDENFKSNPSSKEKVPIRNNENLRYIDFEQTAKYLATISIDMNIVDVMRNVDMFRLHLDMLNSTFNFYVTKSVVDDFICKLIESMKILNSIDSVLWNKRISLIVDYLFDYEGRDLTKSYTHFGFEEVTNETILRELNLFSFRGFENKPHPKRQIIKNPIFANSVNPIIDINSELSHVKSYLEMINESYHFQQVLKGIFGLRMIIHSANSKYNYHINNDVKKFIFKELSKYIVNSRRVMLFMDYIFEYENRDFTTPVKYYACKSETDPIVIDAIYTYSPIGYESQKLPERKDLIPNKCNSKKEAKQPKTSKSAPPPKKSSENDYSDWYNESSPPPKTSTAPPPKKANPPPPPKDNWENRYNKTAPPPSVKPKVSDKVLIENLNKYLRDKSNNVKNVSMFIKIIMTPSNELKSIKKREILELLREFHTDTVEWSTCSITKELHKIITQKLNILRKQCDSSTSPIRPIGSLYEDICRAMNI